MGKRSGVRSTRLIPAFRTVCSSLSSEDANTTALTPTPIVILEGGSADISCNPVGAPAPSITWELDNQIVSFEQTDNVTQFEATLTGTVGGQRDTDVTPGNIISDLHIVSARYPDHNGVYTCIGTNSDDLSVASSSATVAVQVQSITLIIMIMCIIHEINYCLIKAFQPTLLVYVVYIAINGKDGFPGIDISIHLFT